MSLAMRDIENKERRYTQKKNTTETHTKLNTEGIRTLYMYNYTTNATVHKSSRRPPTEHVGVDVCQLKHGSCPPPRPLSSTPRVPTHWVHNHIQLAGAAAKVCRAEGRRGEGRGGEGRGERGGEERGGGGEGGEGRGGEGGER